MSLEEHVNINDNRLEICDNPLECLHCSYLLDKLNNLAVDKILISTPKLPEEVTRIKVPILPIPNNVPFYSYKGIEYLVSRIFKNYNWIKQKKSGIYTPYLKLYFEKNSLFTLPVLQIEIIFLKLLPQKTFVNFIEILETDIPFITGSVGKIEEIEIRDTSELSEILKKPLIFGLPEFKLSGVLFEHGFTEEQIMELNYLHTHLPHLLNVDEKTNQVGLDFLRTQKTMIEEKLQKRQSEEKNCRSEFIASIFKEDNK